MALLSLSATAGTPADFLLRLKSVLPAGWFADATPVLDGVLSGLAAPWATLFGQLAYAQAQTRIATASDLFLDLVAQDFCGITVLRAANEPDASLRARVQRSLLQPRATRAALIAALTQLTGRSPHVFEPRRLGDTGAYGVASTLAYTIAGGYGSFALPFQCFVQVFRPLGAGIAGTNGYGQGAGGYGAGQMQYTTPTMAGGTIRDADINQTIAATVPTAMTAWTVISN